MLTHCTPRTLALVSVASTKVAMSLQGLDLAESRKRVSLGLRCVGSCMFSVQGWYNQPRHGRRFQWPYCIAYTSPHLSHPRAFSGKTTAS